MFIVITYLITFYMKVSKFNKTLVPNMESKPFIANCCFNSTLIPQQ